MINATAEKGKRALWYAIKYQNCRAAVKLIEEGATFHERVVRFYIIIMRPV
jgi:ribosomal protein S6